MAEFHLRALTGNDLRRVTAMHQRAFPNSALTLLGSGAVERYYGWLTHGAHDAVCLGGRPNFMKVAPILEAFRAQQRTRPELEVLLVHTGQHYDRTMSGSSHLREPPERPR